MEVQDTIRLVGATGSPYTQKMIALLRYRRIPYAVTWGDIGKFCEAAGLPAPRPALAPTFLFEKDGGLEAVCDSTPIIRRLEDKFSKRSVLPDDPALSFIDYLIEDFADEWCTKYMFHYRWHFTDDAHKAGTVLPLSVDTSLSETDLAAFKQFFSERQIGRLFVVGSNDTTAAVIDDSYRRFLAAMDRHLTNQAFMLGNRPGTGDFALHGQLSQLVGFDPTPRAIAHEVSLRTVAWVDRLYDLSGLEPQQGDWRSLEDQADTLRGVMEEIGRVYVPAQLSNARATQAGEKEWECEIGGTDWVQRTFPYQAKCLQWTNEHYRALAESDRRRVDSFLEGTGIEKMLFLD